MQASLDPVVEQPTVFRAPGACQRSAIICTQRFSISAVCGYSSLSIMFLSIDSFIGRRASGSDRVVQNVARFWRELPSSIDSSCTMLKTAGAGEECSGMRYFGRHRPADSFAHTSAKFGSMDRLTERRW